MDIFHLIHSHFIKSRQMFVATGAPPNFLCKLHNMAPNKLSSLVSAAICFQPETCDKGSRILLPACPGILAFLGSTAVCAQFNLTSQIWMMLS